MPRKAKSTTGARQKAANAQSQEQRPPLAPGPLLNHVRGHEAVIGPLLDAISQQRLPSTILFAGPSGVGKKKIAFGLAQCLTCERTSLGQLRACGECGACIRIARHQSENLLFIEPEGAGIKIEQSQEILRFISLTRLGKARIVIIDESHLLNPQAGNALLKSLEEPPEGTYFFLITANSGAILSTIRSRAQMFRFNALADDVVKALTRTDDWIVRSAQGSVEAALRMSENAEDWSSLRRVSLALFEDVVGPRSGGGLEALKERAKDRASALFVTQIWARLLRDVAYTSVQSSKGVDYERLAMPDCAPLSQDLAGKMSLAWIEKLVDLNQTAEQDIGRNVDRSLVFDNFWFGALRASSGQEPERI